LSASVHKKKKGDDKSPFGKENLAPDLTLSRSWKRQTKRFSGKGNLGSAYNLGKKKRKNDHCP